MPIFHVPLTHALTLLTLVSITSVFSTDEQTEKKESIYQLRTATRDGIGKFYMGREISRGASWSFWLERPKREQEERTDLLIKYADQTSGSNCRYWCRIRLLLLQNVRFGPQRKVFAVDISQMLGIIRAKIKEQKVTMLSLFKVRSLGPC